MRFAQLIKQIGDYQASSPLEDFEVSAVTSDSKKVVPGSIFVAVKGARADGHDFIAEALERGARAVIVQESVSCSPKQAPYLRVRDTRKALACAAAAFHGNPSCALRVTGVTGTNGKTTISYLAEAVLKKAGFEPAVIGTVNYRFKDRVIPSKNTTPGAPELQAMLAEMVRAGVTHLAMEVSSHALDQGRTDGIRFSSAIFTNLTQDHLDYHGTLENYFKVKARLFRELEPSAFAVINNDNEYGRKLRALTHAAVVTYGIERMSEVVARDIRFDIGHTECVFDVVGKKFSLRFRLIGRHNVYNMLAVVAWAWKEGIDLAVAAAALERFTSVPGRLERIETDKGFAVFVDYAHTEDALRNVISTLREVSSRRIIVVFGCGGERDRTKRPKMGRVVSELADYAIVTSDNPRSEEPEAIIADIRQGIKKDNYCIIPDRHDAIKGAIALAQDGDIVLIAGKGHENYQVFKDRTVIFDDRQAVRECLR